MENIEQIIQTIAPYNGFILVGIFISMLVVAAVFINAILRKAKQFAQERERINKENLKNINMKKITNDRHGEVIRTVVSADGIDPNPLSYLVIMDGGHEKYVASYTVMVKPKRTTFGVTFNELFNFPNVTSSVFINPVSEEEASRVLDHHVTVLASEISAASGDPNRRRKLQAQIAETNAWASEIENGENKSYKVGFIFSLYDDNVADLKKQCDSFYSSALARNIVVSNSFGLQAEAYALNGPYAGNVNILSKTVPSNIIPLMTMDKYSVSTLFNYLQASYIYRDGVPIGRDLHTRTPVTFDLYSPSHDSMSLIIAGKPGSGKSLTIKVMAMRQILLGYHYVAIDTQQKKGRSEGEYAQLAEKCGGVNFQIAKNSKECLNLFDVSETLIAEETDDKNKKYKRTLDLSGKITILVNNLCSMILTSANSKFDSVETQAYVRRVLTDTVMQTYNDFKIYDGDVDSLYTDDSQTVGSISAQRRKRLPTICDFYQRLLRNAKKNNDETLNKAYSLAIHALKDYVRELYYTKDSIKFLTREDYKNLPTNDRDVKVYRNKEGREEEVVAVNGVQSYFDGQSTIAINRDCPFVNLDISLLTDNQKNLARQICIAWVNENFIKKNSETQDTATKLVAIFDEVHECYNDEFARSTIEIAVREARKRYVGLILATQTLREHENYKETQSILKLAECKFVFRQDYQDRDYLVKSIGVTESQADIIVSGIGTKEDDSEENKRKHAGEMCILDGKRVVFCKVDYLQRTESMANTDASREPA